MIKRFIVELMFKLYKNRVWGRCLFKSLQVGKWSFMKSWYGRPGTIYHIATPRVTRAEEKEFQKYKNK